MDNIVDNNVKIENLIYKIRGVEVMLDSDIAYLYGVDTKRVNESYRRNLEKFPSYYTWELNKEEISYLRSQNASANISNKSRTNPRVFTEQGLYMLATILKSSVATRVTIAIMDTFVKMRHYINFNNEILPNRVMLLEDKVDKNTKNINKLFDMFDPKVITKDLIVFNGEFFKAYYAIEKIFESAKEEIIVIDNYADKELLKEISKYQKNIKVISKNIDDKLKEKYLKEFHNVEFITSDIFHDRFIILDRNILFTCGSSFKDFVKKCSTINLIQDKFILDSILEKIFS